MIAWNVWKTVFFALALSVGPWWECFFARWWQRRVGQDREGTQAEVGRGDGPKRKRSHGALSTQWILANGASLAEGSGSSGIHRSCLQHYQSFSILYGFKAYRKAISTFFCTFAFQYSFTLIFNKGEKGRIIII